MKCSCPKATPGTERHNPRAPACEDRRSSDSIPVACKGGQPSKVSNVQIEHLTDRFYHYCRHCRSKLQAPISNRHQAFCTAGCHASFYRKRCLVCEGYRGTFTRKLCHKPACRNKYRRNRAFFDFDRSSKGGGSGVRQTDFRSAHFSGLISGWFVVAGPGFGSSALHCATVGAEEAIATTNCANLRHWRENCLIQPHHPPVNILGGYEFPDAPTIDLSPAWHAAIAPDGAQADPNPYLNRIPDDLSIPTFLKRDMSMNIDIKSYRCVGSARHQIRLLRSPPGSQRQVGGQATGYRQKRCHGRRS
jgi:hypothetical protein